MLTPTLDCEPGFKLLEMPVKLRDGAGGAVTFTVNAVLALAPALSVTVNVTLRLAGAVGVPERVPLPVVPLEMLPQVKPETE